MWVCKPKRNWIIIYESDIIVKENIQAETQAELRCSYRKNDMRIGRIGREIKE